MNAATIQVRVASKTPAALGIGRFELVAADGQRLGVADRLLETRRELVHSHDGILRVGANAAQCPPHAVAAS